MARFSSTSVGDGITQRSRQEVSYDPASLEDLADLRICILQAHAKLNEPWGRFSRMIAGFRALWKHMEETLPSDETKRAERFKIRSTEEWYVLQIVRYGALVEKYLSSRTWEAISLAIEIGQLSTEYHFKFTHEKAALAGAKLDEGRLKSNIERRGEPAHVRVQYARSLQETGLGVVESLRLAAEHFGISFGMMKKDYYLFRRSTTDGVEHP